ncbi:MAG: ATP-binding protein [Bacteroidales bacterium]|nr:ATP-binding protein [Bacteroidales bacterium]
MSLAERIAGKIQIIDEMPQYSNQLIYGLGGMGKTTYGGTALNPLIGNAEGGTVVLQGKRIPAWKITKFFELNDLGEFLEEHCVLRDRLREMAMDGASQAQLKQIKGALWNLDHLPTDPRGNREPLLFDTFVLDSATDVQTRSLEGVLMEPKRLEKHDPDKANLEDYGKTTQQMRKLFRFLKDLPINLVLICLALDDKEDSGEPIVRPHLMPKLSSEVIGMMDCVGYMFTKAVEGNPLQRRLLVQPYGKFRAKLRRPEGAPKVISIVEPNWNKVHQLVTTTKTIEEIQRGE